MAKKVFSVIGTWKFEKIKNKCKTAIITRQLFGISVLEKK
jgi:hypothetical protein